jgi:starvation-inducible DNA-binding protein
MSKQRIFAGAPATVAGALAVGILLSLSPGSAQVLGPHNIPTKPQEPSPRAKPDRTQGESDTTIEDSNQTLDQPPRIQFSYPLKGDEERRRSVKGLQQLTVDLLALHNMYKEAHWDLTGPLYLQLHEYYQKQADIYLQQADTFAERVLHLGASVDGRHSTIARTTKLPELPAGYLSDDHSLKLLLDRVSVLQKEIYQLIGETDGGDPPTSNKLQDLAYAVDKDLWQLRAHLQKPSARRGDLPWFRQQAHEPSGK